MASFLMEILEFLLAVLGLLLAVVWMILPFVIISRLREICLRLSDIQKESARTADAVKLSSRILAQQEMARLDAPEALPSAP